MFIRTKKQLILPSAVQVESGKQVDLLKYHTRHKVSMSTTACQHLTGVVIHTLVELYFFLLWSQLKSTGDWRFQEMCSAIGIILEFCCNVVGMVTTAMIPQGCLRFQPCVSQKGEDNSVGSLFVQKSLLCGHQQANRSFHLSLCHRFHTAGYPRFETSRRPPNQDSHLPVS